VVVPNLEEVMTEAGMRCITEDSAKSFFDHHQNNALWINQFNRLIDWRRKLKTWSDNDRKPKSNKPNASHRPTAPDRNSGTYNAAPLSDAAKAKIR
jgi:hypothetical protein